VLGWKRRHQPTSGPDHFKKFTTEIDAFDPDLFYSNEKERNLNQDEKIKLAEERLAEAEAAVSAARAQLEELAKPKRFSKEPAEGTVLHIVKKYGANSYTYIVIRVSNAWYSTGSINGRNTVRWAELEEFIGDDTDVMVLGAYSHVPRV
jgi:hypothetical protein